MIYRPQPDGRILADAETIATMHRISKRHARRQTPTACDTKTRRLLYPLHKQPTMSYHAR
jgi:hypothetical protein